jgi:short-subunit dehydrogenase
LKRKIFQNKNILITGASSGIGYSLSLELAKQGANLILTARRKDRLEELAKLIQNCGGNAIISVVDVTKKEDFKTAISLSHQGFGPIDIAIANAAIPMHGKFEELTTENYKRLFETNVFGVLNTSYACIDDLKKTNGKLVIIGSVMAYMTTPGTSAYSMSKFAVRAFAETVRNELIDYEVKVVLINPGFVESEMRQVDNLGVRDPNRRDWVPPFLMMPAHKAAKKVVTAIYRGKREKFIGLNGYIGYWFRQYMPWLYFALLNTGNRLIRQAGNK